MINIQIIVGSAMGTAEQIAEIAAERLRSGGCSVWVNTYAEAADLVRDSEEVLLLCHSNTGAGDLPDNILSVYLHLTRDFPVLVGRFYGVINLCDSSYTTFNEAGRMLDAAFADVGAKRIGTPLLLDAASGEDREALSLDWLDDWLIQLKAELKRAGKIS